MSTSTSITSTVDHSLNLQGNSPLESDETMQLLNELHLTKRELDIATAQFDATVDPMLVDHIIFRIGAAERRLNYLLQEARKLHVVVEGVRWDKGGRG